MRNLLLILTIISAPAFAATAYFTGNQRYVTTPTFSQGVECEYQYAGNKFWVMFNNTRICPVTIPT